MNDQLFSAGDLIPPPPPQPTTPEAEPVVESVITPVEEPVVEQMVAPAAVETSVPTAPMFSPIETNNVLARSPRNKLLQQFVVSTLDRNTVNLECKVPCPIVRETSQLGAYEEIGSDDTKSFAMVVLGDDKQRLIPVITLRRKVDRTALLSINVGSRMICAVHDKNTGKVFLSVYIVKSMKSGENTVNVDTEFGIKFDILATEYKPSDTYEGFDKIDEWMKHPAISAILDYFKDTQNVLLPLYVKRLTNTKFNLSLFNQTITNGDLIKNKLITKSSIEESTDYVLRELANEQTELSQRKLYCSLYQGDGYIYGIILGFGKRNKQNKQIELIAASNFTFYPGGRFHFPDEDDTYSYDELKEMLVEKNNILANAYHMY